jgi:hypothetical protein
MIRITAPTGSDAFHVRLPEPRAAETTTKATTWDYTHLFATTTAVLPVMPPLLNEYYLCCYQ